MTKDNLIDNHTKEIINETLQYAIKILEEFPSVEALKILKVIRQGL
jgi:hypothetical protein